MLRTTTLIFATLALSLPIPAQEPTVELGAVDWSTDLEAAAKQSAVTNRPLFVQFQEIPGCETCQTYGRDVLLHPLLIEAIEDCFQPVLVYNNRKGTDAMILERFKEPAWNNPVVRLMNSDLEDLIPRRDRVWDAAGIATRMMAALDAAGQEVPVYLELVAAENPRQELATFAMHCFWEGEAKFGLLPGVTKTLAGWMDGKEVVDVAYDPEVISYDKLVKVAKEMSCASTVFTSSDEQAAVAERVVSKDIVQPSDGATRPAETSDRKYYLRNSPLKYLPLTPLQATRVNAALKTKNDWERWLSPRQTQLLLKIRNCLAESPTALNDLEPPEELTGLYDYQRLVNERLTKSLTTTAAAH